MRAYERYFIVCITAAYVIGNVMGQQYYNNDNNQYGDFEAQQQQQQQQQHENIHRRPDQIMNSDFYSTNDEKTLYDDESEPNTDFDPSDDKYRLPRHPYTHGYKHRSLCEVETRTIDLNDNPDWEFYPESYTERRCQHPFNSETHRQNSVCHVGNGNECVSLNHTMYFIKRRRVNLGKDCWESHVVNNVPYSCECMWPEKIKHKYEPSTERKMNKNFLHRRQ